MYVDHDTILLWDHFPATKICVVNYKKISTPGTVPKYWLVFSYIRSEDYELDLNFDHIESNKQSDHTSNDKVQIFRESVVVIEEELFDDVNLTDGTTFLAALIKRAKTRGNK